MSNIRKGQIGLSLIELIVAFTILSLLATMSVPLARYKVRRDKQQELRRALKEIRDAIDKYKDLSDTGQLGIQEKLGSDGYPESLEILVKGVKQRGTDKRKPFLRRIPCDPFTGSTEWGKRSTQDDPSSTSWGGQNLFDVYSKTTEKAADGTPYSEW